MGLKILVIDDSSVMRRIITNQVREIGLEIEAVFHAADGLEALNKLETEPVDLILSDINMPNMDGLEFLKNFREKFPGHKAKIVMVTTEGTLPAVKQAIAYGVTGFIKKPFTPDILHREIRKQLGN